MTSDLKVVSMQVLVDLFTNNNPEFLLLIPQVSR